ncbi:hypothetical protein AMS68_006482 [Peltaster fructicola]|uniref:Uncharacterized protein n=1 Tax=Peltaster fructicola TaxID=286661 RepID=A0A6H0Y224_9PEZI|nr:hypothetical protein AMS68_006482 [Peltaster fructicola]
MARPIAFIIGAGKNIGASTAKVLQSQGYRVAQAARSVDTTVRDDTNIFLKVDLASPKAITDAFTELRQVWGEPGVVIYNGATVHPAKPEVFSLSTDDLINDLTVNVTSVYAAAKESVQGFKTLPASASKTFIATGNCLNEGVLLEGRLVSLGMGKSAAAHMIASASVGYAQQGFKFYYVDERTAEGKPMLNGVNGPGHAEFFASLADGLDVPWHATFVSGQGYKKFDRPE